MTLLTGSEPNFQAVQGMGRGYAGWSERIMRDALEHWARNRWPDHRIVHELVVGEGKTRADMVSIGTDHMVAFEIKGGGDVSTRMLHQVGLAQLAIPEVWVVITDRHGPDAELIKHLLPSLGVIRIDGVDRVSWRADPSITTRVSVTVVDEPKPFLVVPRATACLLWRAELETIVRCERLDAGRRPTRAKMIDKLLEHCHPVQVLQHCCTALRARDALWRADPPIHTKPHIREG